MNEELIRKLHDQAWGETHEKAIAVTETPIDFQKVLRERFAQLIVLECMDVFGRDLPDPGDGRMTEVVDRICRVAEHFAVE